MYSIGEFAKKCNTTISELRFYDKKGLLPADQVTESSGRRYYTEESYDKYQKIQRFQEAGFSLADIQAHLDESDHLSNTLFYAKKREHLKKQLELLDELEKDDAIEYIRPKKRYSAPLSEKVEIDSPHQLSNLIDVLHRAKSSK